MKVGDLFAWDDDGKGGFSFAGIIYNTVQGGTMFGEYWYDRPMQFVNAGICDNDDSPDGYNAQHEQTVITRPDA